jgi:hypothetical protein
MRDKLCPIQGRDLIVEHVIYIQYPKSTTCPHVIMQK